jgi:TolA-binding protein
MTLTKPSKALDPEDLSIRVRRGDANADERRGLELFLEGSAWLRVSHQVGRDFDQAARVRPGDDELVARASLEAISRFARPRRRRAFRWLGVAATLALATTAAAGVWLTAGPSERTRDRPVPASTGKVERLATAKPNPAAVTSTVAPVAEPAPTLGTVAPALRKHESIDQATERTAAELFREANAARRAGDYELARSLYGELQVKHPETDEASVSRVSLGKLLLTMGRAREAEREFRTYLATGKKNLEEEVLVGRADALARLADGGEERRVWESLLRNHPSSVYAARARQRLLELGASSAIEPR